MRKEGRWEAASLFRDERRKELRKSGRKRDEANEAAWKAMLDEYPPLPAPTTENQPKRSAPPDDHDLEALRSKSAEGNPDLVRDTLWVYERLEDARVVASDAPSFGAWGLLQWARGDRQRFFEQMLPKAMAVRVKGDAEQNEKEEQAQQDENKQRDELREMIAEFERKRLHDTPDEIKEKCRRCIVEWQRKRGLNLPAGVADNLALEVAHFVDYYVQAAIKHPDLYRRKG